MNILLLEDDKILAHSLKEFLELEGYKVDTVYRGSDVFDFTYKSNYDLYILDINVPDINGFDILTSLKEAGDTTPAIYITALTDINSISKGFEIGADDYIKKPFNPEELVIRIKNKYEEKNTWLHIGDISYNPSTYILKKKGSIVSLGRTQQKLFHKLMLNQGEVVEFDSLILLLENPTHNALRVNIAKLKNKLKIKIRNIRTQGYMIESL